MTTDLLRRSVGLTEAHKELIRLLAERVVNEFLAETDPADTDQPEEHREVSQ